MDAACVRYKSVFGHGFPSHTHSYYEFRYNAKGSYKAEIGDKHILLSEGSLVFIPPLTIHSFYGESYPSDILQMQFIPRMLGVAHLAHAVPVLTPYGLLAENGCIPVVSGSRLHNILKSMLSFCPSTELTAENPDGNISIDDFTPPHSHAAMYCYFPAHFMSARREKNTSRLCRPSFHHVWGVPTTSGVHFE